MYFSEWKFALQQIRVPGDVDVPRVRGSVLISPRSHEPGYQLENKKVQVENITIKKSTKIISTF